jgi:DNA processing protein
VIRGSVFDLFDDGVIESVCEGLGRRGVDSDHGSRDDAFAGALWSCLVEPGDAVGGVLRAAFGPASALSALRLDDEALRRALVEAGVVDVDVERIDLEAARSRWAPRNSASRFRGALRAAEVLGIRLVVPGDAHWPAGLDDLGVHAPAALWVRGDPSRLVAGPGVAVVGSRAATAYGEQVAGELADSLASRGVAIHSGGAYGIDGCAHRAALAAGGTTVAVMAGGVDRFYPAAHHDLLARVAAEGAVVSETPCGTSPSRWRFLQRNRLLAAMSGATVVVEAGHRSGALNTAGHAQALDRPLGAVPGPVTSPSSAGCHRLLRETEAVCVTGAADVLALLEPGLLPVERGDGPERASPAQLRLRDALGRRAKSVGRLAADTGLGEAEVRTTLAVLELEGAAEEREHGWAAAG